MAPRLEMRGISKHFLGVQALSGVDVTVDGGEVLALVGENGAGKSDADQGALRRAASRRGRGADRRRARPAELARGL